MIQFFRKAINTSSIKDPRSCLIKDEYRKKRLKENLLTQIRKLQKSHVGNENIVDRNDEDAASLCMALEAIFLHEINLNHKISFESFESIKNEDTLSISFWELLKKVTHKDVLTQLQQLVVKTDVGLCRAWLRLALNDGIITSYLNAIIAENKFLSTFYNSNAFLLDEELPNILKDILQGILQFEFRLNYNSSKLDTWDLITLQLAGYLPEKIEKENIPSTNIINVSESSSFVFPKSASFGNENESLLCSINSDPQNFILQDSSSNDSNLECMTEDLAESVNSNQIVENEKPIGNRLAGQEWTGWSSSFDEDVKIMEDVQRDIDDHSDVFNKIPHKDFDSLLLDYSIKNTLSCDSSKQNDADITLVDKNKSPRVSECVEDTDYKNASSEVVSHNLNAQANQSFKSAKDFLSQLSIIAIEKGLDKQRFSCMKCGKSIGLIYGSFNVCSFDGGYYCFDCHGNDEHILSARIIHNWDFRKYPVSKYNKMFLKKIDEEPLFHIDELNPALYDVVPLLQEVKFLRTQLSFIKSYIQTCSDVVQDFKRRLWPRDYLCDDVHQYSIIDLVEVQSGQLAHNLKKIVADFSRHIYKCKLCKEKGFICEYCHDQEIIYPFQLDIVSQCLCCLSVYHQKCRQEKRCPKCVRVRLRSQGNNEKERHFSVTQIENSETNDIL
ncbi:uncharacterized protein LOC100213973 isoform X1 [Hydra vulgaris]|uniref:uncharacterized protein LOC100213973 isoform X1 n=1 Tax=Hydra vulgaris TaxID=6087 RepID=UPI001F5E6250|nr:uncharacterized protein LOC100213973 [Hydra vulgaris]